MQQPSWAPAVYVGASVATLAAGFGAGVHARQSLAKSSAPSAPPGAVFMAVWFVLYILTGCAATYQGFHSTKAQHWVSLALLLATVIVAWAWPTIWDQTARGHMPAGAPAWTIAAMLLVGGTGITLVPSATSGALWAPFLLWLIVALGLCLQGASASASTSCTSASA